MRLEAEGEETRQRTENIQEMVRITDMGRIAEINNGKEERQKYLERNKKECDGERKSQEGTRETQGLTHGVRQPEGPMRFDNSMKLDGNEHK